MSLTKKRKANPSGAAALMVDRRILPNRFLIVSNRLPYNLSYENGEVQYERGVGGLVTALDPILRTSGGTWIGWTGSFDEMPDKVSLKEGKSAEQEYELKPLTLTREEVDGFYLGYSNKALWPLFHYFQEHCEFNSSHWDSFKAVSARFAEAIVKEYKPGDLIWIHDYHLMLVPALVRRMLPSARIAFFLHIPFPSPEIFLVEPHAEELTNGMLGADLIGFHLDSYASNFMDVVAEVTPHRFSRPDKIRVNGRPVRVGSFPISIDFEHFAKLAAHESISGKIAAIRDSYRADILVLGVDRLDYTKGILERLHAVEIMLDRHKELQGRFTFIQISSPTRPKVHVYQELREKVEQMVGRINGRFGGKGCIPIDYRYENQSQEDLVAMYRAADVALVTPLRDGMNLIAKEYAAARIDNSGALVLSRFAGAYEEMDDVLMVNPYDPESTAERLYAAIHMPAEEKERRMKRMRNLVRRNDIYWWLERYLRAML